MGCEGQGEARGARVIELYVVIAACGKSLPI
jgi:hypothetical protein